LALLRSTMVRKGHYYFFSEIGVLSVFLKQLSWWRLEPVIFGFEDHACSSNHVLMSNFQIADRQKIPKTLTAGVV
jgi:hypothetical protein